MYEETDSLIMAELMNWCFARIPGKRARRRRCQVLFQDFKTTLGNDMPIVTVAGTSGKGSTCAMLESVLLASNHVAGVCMKPHMHSFRERIRVAGRAVSAEVLTEHASTVFAQLREFVRVWGREFHPSLFEALLLIAASVFRENGVTFAVFEAGVGGSSDATSLLPADFSVVTSVGLDHQKELGETVEEIALDKAGIAPAGATLVLGANLSTSARSTIEAECNRRGVRAIRANADSVEVISESVDGQLIRLTESEEDQTVFLRFPGRHQSLNFATVWALTKAMQDLHYIPSTDPISNVERTRLPGRFEYLRGTPSWLLDVAHNTESIRALLSLLSTYFSSERIVFIVGATESHPHHTFVNLICEWGARVAFCEGFPKAIPTETLKQQVTCHCKHDRQFHTPSSAIEHYLQQGCGETTVVVTGSLFLVGQCRKALMERGILCDHEA